MKRYLSLQKMYRMSGKYGRNVRFLRKKYPFPSIHLIKTKKIRLCEFIFYQNFLKNREVAFLNKHVILGLNLEGKHIERTQRNADAIIAAIFGHSR